MHSAFIARICVEALLGQGELLLHFIFRGVDELRRLWCCRLRGGAYEGCKREEAEGLLHDGVTARYAVSVGGRLL